MLNRLPTPTQLPPLATMLADIGNPDAAELASALDVKPAAVRRWLRDGMAPRPVMLSVFWLTRWGMSLVDAEAVNAARHGVGMARARQRELQALEAEIERLVRLGDFGTANEPRMRA